MSWCLINFTSFSVGWNDKLRGDQCMGHINYGFGGGFCYVQVSCHILCPN